MLQIIQQTPGTPSVGLTDVWIFLILSPMDVVVNPLPFSH